MRGHRTRWTKAYESVAVLFVRAYTTLRGADELNYPFKNTKSTPLLVISGKEKWSYTKVTLWQLLHSVSTLSTWSVLLSGLCVFVYNVSLTLLLALLHLFGWNHLYHANSPFFPQWRHSDTSVATGRWYQRSEACFCLSRGLFQCILKVFTAEALQLAH